MLFFRLLWPQPAIFATAGVHPTRSLEFLPIPQRYTIGNLSAEAFTLAANANTAAIEAFDAEIAAKNAVCFFSALLSLQPHFSRVSHALPCFPHVKNWMRCVGGGARLA